MLLVHLNHEVQKCLKIFCGLLSPNELRRIKCISPGQKLELILKISINVYSIIDHFNMPMLNHKISMSPTTSRFQ